MKYCRLVLLVASAALVRCDAIPDKEVPASSAAGIDEEERALSDEERRRQQFNRVLQ
jgi:hypothetical protein